MNRNKINYSGWLLAVLALACASKQTTFVDDAVNDPDLFDTSKHNRAPHITLQLAKSADEGSEVVAQINVTDSDSKQFQYFYDWDGNGVFEDVSNAAQMRHTYKQHGDYRVRVRVQDDHNNNDEATQLITIRDLSPTAKMRLPHGIEEGAWVAFDASESSSVMDAIVKYEWDWNYNGKTFHPAPQQGVKVEQRWLKNGAYQVALRVTDADGSSSMQVQTVEVTDATPKARITGPSSLQVGEVAIFSAQDSSSVVDAIVSYAWNAAVQEQPEAFKPGQVLWRHVWRKPGKYRIALRLRDADGSEANTTHDVQVLDIPKPTEKKGVRKKP